MCALRQRDSTRHLQGPDLRDRLSALGAEAVGTSPEELAVFLKAESERWQRASKAAGICQSRRLAAPPERSASLA
jgi:tripartite-type tricarboxylate transporter receptor subunit TctC